MVVVRLVEKCADSKRGRKNTREDEEMQDMQHHTRDDDQDG